MDEKKKPAEEEEKEKKTPETTEEGKQDESKSDGKADDKSASDEKQADENGDGADKPDKPDKPAESDEGKKDEKPEEKAEDPTAEVSAKPDEKDEEILRLKTQIAAMQLGVKLDCMEDAVAIAESYVKAGKNEDINSALTAVVKKYPDMKADGTDGKKQGGFKVGADSSEKDKKTDSDKLSNAFGIKKKK